MRTKTGPSTREHQSSGHAGVVSAEPRLRGPLLFTAEIPGNPVAQVRSRVAFQSRRGRPLRKPHSYYPEKSAQYRHDLTFFFNIKRIGHSVIEGMVRVECEFYLTPRSFWSDIDNLLKQVLDALTDAGVIRNDNRVVEVECRKFRETVQPRLVVRVRS